jgi:hypothetical protein
MEKCMQRFPSLNTEDTSDVLTVISTKITVVWDVTPWSLVESSSNPGLVKWDLWWTKWRWGRFSPGSSVTPANLHSTKFSIIIITRGRNNRPFSGRRAEWTQLGLHSTLCKLKKLVKSYRCFGGNWSLHIQGTLLP